VTDGAQRTSGTAGAVNEAAQLIDGVGTQLEQEIEL
jgi:hypothetical protein